MHTQVRNIQPSLEDMDFLLCSVQQLLGWLRRMSKDPGDLSSIGTVGWEKSLREYGIKKEGQLYLQSFPCHITEPSIYPGKQQGSLRGLTGVHAHIFVWIMEGNNTAEKERGTELQTGRLPRAEIQWTSLKARVNTKQRALEAIPYLLQLNQLGRCHGKAAIGTNTQGCAPVKLFGETGSRFGLQV